MPSYQRPKTKPWPALKKKRRRRAWLNESRQGGSAHIIWSVEPPTFSKNKEKKRKRDAIGWIWGPSASLELSDCNRKIDLEFPLDDCDCGPPSSHTFRKIDRLIKELQDFRIAMERALERKKELKLEHPGAK